jgi:hypothetical protein
MVILKSGWHVTFNYCFYILISHHFPLLYFSRNVLIIYIYTWIVYIEVKNQILSTTEKYCPPAVPHNIKKQKFDSLALPMKRKFGNGGAVTLALSFCGCIQTMAVRYNNVQNHSSSSSSLSKNSTLTRHAPLVCSKGGEVKSTFVRDCSFSFVLSVSLDLLSLLVGLLRSPSTSLFTEYIRYSDHLSRVVSTVSRSDEGEENQ